ncbi:MAG: ABC transporter ATP-binding protein [Lentisphaerae bacterium]|nr:ABC transporter ATP-binding protein [Lentisphaerota bacterium]
MTLEVESLRFAYGRVPVLRDITCRVEAGRLVAVLGRNGSGKTTLLKTVNRILRPDGGRVLLEGRDLARLSPRQIARRIAYMPQTQTAAYGTVFEAVLLGRRARGGGTGDADLRHVADILNLVRLEALAMRSTRTLSGGELQKVVLGRALAQEPRVLLLDEPISHLDPANQIEIMSLLHEVTRGRRMTSLLVTHDLNSALRFADRFLLLKDGRVLADGDRAVLTPEAIRAAYGIDAAIADVDGTPVLVPHLKAVRPHRHLHTHAHAHARADGSVYTHVHPHGHRHAHEVDDHVYDHDHAAAHGEHEHTHPAA